MARMLPREAENGVGMNRSARGGKCKRFERSNGLDTALYKTINHTFFYLHCHACLMVACTSLGIVSPKLTPLPCKLDYFPNKMKSSSLFYKCMEGTKEGRKEGTYLFDNT